MRNILSDGTVIESNLSINSPNSLTQYVKDFQSKNGTLKVGNVIEILYPEHLHNISKKVIEYHVAVLERSPQGSSNLNTYSNCVVSNLFGSANNHTNYTYQAKDKINTKGASVLILCVGGNAQGGSAIILGGLDATSTNKVHSAKDGQFYDFNFNGIQQLINNDGEFSLIFNSKIDVKGKKANEKAAGTAVKMDKDGRLTLSDNEGQFFKFDRTAQSATWGNGAESILIDKKNKTISMTSSDKINITSKGAMSLSASTIDSKSDKDYNISSGANLSIKSKANMNLKADAGINMNASAEFYAKSGTVAMIEGGTVAQIKGGTTTLLGAGTMPVGIAGISMSLGFDSHNAPVLSTLLTGSFTVFAGT